MLKSRVCHFHIIYHNKKMLCFQEFTSLYNFQFSKFFFSEKAYYYLWEYLKFLSTSFNFDNSFHLPYLKQRSSAYFGLTNNNGFLRHNILPHLLSTSPTGGFCCWVHRHQQRRRHSRRQPLRQPNWSWLLPANAGRSQWFYLEHFPAKHCRRPEECAKCQPVDRQGLRRCGVCKQQPDSRQCQLHRRLQWRCEEGVYRY